ncbi:MAG: hypothetical protein Q4B04_02970 [bacterium]|nr:hypothetical protein [bacterium]
MLKILNKFLLNSKNINHSAVYWNALSAAMNSFQTMVLLMVITRLGTMNDSGIFVMAYAVGNLMLNIGKFGVRQFQVTDTGEKYGFGTYLKNRKFSSLLMLVLSALYISYNLIFNSYTYEKAAVIFIICIAKCIEAYEDVYHGLMQQKGRLDVAAKILSLRLFIFIVGCALMFILTKNLLLTVAVNTALTALLAWFFNRFAFAQLHYAINNTGNIKKLFAECFPLCACMCLNMYIANAPKYVIDSVVNSEVQTYFNIVFMPVFVIALMANFVFQPSLKGLGEIFNAGNTLGFIKKIMVLSAAVIGICAVTTVIGAFVGTPFLGYIYNVNLSDYNLLLIIFIISGGIIALQNLFIIAITVVRYQRYMIYGYAVTALLLLLLGKPILINGDIISLTLFFLASMILLLAYCILLLWLAVRKSNKPCR